MQTATLASAAVGGVLGGLVGFAFGSMSRIGGLGGAALGLAVGGVGGGLLGAFEVAPRMGPAASSPIQPGNYSITSNQKTATVSLPAGATWQGIVGPTAAVVSPGTSDPVTLPICPDTGVCASGAKTEFAISWVDGNGKQQATALEVTYMPAA